MNDWNKMKWFWALKGPRWNTKEEINMNKVVETNNEELKSSSKHESQKKQTQETNLGEWIN